MFSTILEFCRGLNDNVVVQTSRPVQQCQTFQCTIPQEIGGRSSVRFLLPPRMHLRRAPDSRRTRAPTPRQHPGLFCQPLEYSTIVMATQSAAAVAASNDVFIRSIRLYAFGRKSREGGGLFPPAETDPGVFYQEETIRCIWRYVEQVDVSGCKSPTG